MQGMTIAQIITILLPVFLISITLHEVMHAVTAKWLGDTTSMGQGRISLNPLAHIDPFTTLLLPLMLALAGLPPFAAARPVQVDKYNLKWGDFGMALVAIAGPLTNLFLAFVAGIFIADVESRAMYNFLEVMLVFNVGMFVFNLIPFPPLDGSRLLYAFAPRGVQNIMDAIESTGLLGFAVFLFATYSTLVVVIGNLVDRISNHIVFF